MKRKWLAIIGILDLLVGLVPGAVQAQATAQVVVPIPGPALDIFQTTVNDGAGGQTDPHISGDWVSYTDNSVYGIRFQNLDLGFPSDRLIPHLDGSDFDSLSDINGSNIVFMRARTGYQGVYLSQIDLFGNPTSTVEISPAANAIRRRAVVGGDTIAYEDHSIYNGTSTAQPEIAISDISNPSAPAHRLTNDTLADQYPSVSPDGNVVVWTKCTNTTFECDVWRAERVAGAWGSPEQVTGDAGYEGLPDTNGPVTVYSAESGTAYGEDNIHWTVKNEAGAFVESELDLPGLQRNPNIADNFITFESSSSNGSQYDIYLYDLAKNRLYQLTNTTISESLNDISTGPGGLVRVVWAQPKIVYPYDIDIQAISFLLDTTPPVITPNIQGTLGQNGWYTSDVTLSWTVTDNESPVESMSGCDPVSITSDQTAAQYTCSADSAGGASHETVTIQRDATKPVTSVTGVTEGATYLLGSVPQAGCSSTDTLSGVVTEATLTTTGGDAQGAGQITTTCSGALDAAGNPADPALVHYTVNNPANTFTFTGFFQPVDNWPIENTMKAGASVPVKFSLGGDMGLNIFSAGYPASRQVSCPSSSAVTADAIEETTSSNSGLSYDAASGQYIYVWKTNKTWGGTCRVFTILFVDGSSQQALFKFTK